MSDKVKLGICVGVGLVGFYLVVSRLSIPLIIIGFLMVAAVVPFGHYYWAQLQAPKNPMKDEIEALLKKQGKNQPK